MTKKFQPISELISLKGKTAIVTGSANGIGRAISLRLAEAGSDLYLLDRDEKGLKEVKGLAEKFKVKAECFSLDLSEKKAIDDFWKKISPEKADILVNNAGIYPFLDFCTLNEDCLTKVMSVNLYSVLWMCQNMINLRKKRGGTIVNISSIEAIMPFKDGLVQYSTGKIGVIALTRDLAREFGKKGFKVNAVLPGGINTKGTRGSAKTLIKNPKLLLDGYNFWQRLPLRRLGDPDEIARAVLFLCSQLSSYVEGSLLTVDGGFLSS